MVGEQQGGWGGGVQRERGGGQGEREEKKWRVGGAAGCFTPGLFKETAQGMPLAHLTKHFPSPSLFFSPPPLTFFSRLFVFFLSIAGCAPVKSSGPPSLFPPQPFEDASETFSRRRRRGPVPAPMFQNE